MNINAITVELSPWEQMADLKRQIDSSIAELANPRLFEIARQTITARIRDLELQLARARVAARESGVTCA